MVLVLQVLVLWVVLAAGAAVAVSLLLGRAHRLQGVDRPAQAAPAEVPAALSA